MSPPGTVLAHGIGGAQDLPLPFDLVLQAGAVLVRVRMLPAAEFDASTRKMAETLFSAHFVYVFEATSVLILAALVGAVVLAKKEL